MHCPVICHLHSDCKKTEKLTCEQRSAKLEGKYFLESTDPRKSEIRAHLRP